MAEEMAEEKPAVAVADCPSHEGHAQECYDRGHGDGWDRALDYAYQLLREGRYDDFYEFYEHHTEGQVAT